MIISFGIETSCDDTSIALVTSEKNILLHETISQNSHAKYGGVVPELASREHMKGLHHLITKYRDQIKQADIISITSGPGLMGSLMIGVMSAKAISHVTRKQIFAVNHMEGHALTPRLCNNIQFPFLLILISGGHTEMLICRGVGQYMRLGRTLDDAVGEAFDKIARYLNIEYPGGPIIEQYAQLGDIHKFAFPQPLMKKKCCDFSFSGLKTSVKNLINRLNTLSDQNVYDICASFQYTISRILRHKITLALNMHSEINTIVISGGVAANQYLKSEINSALPQYNIVFPPQNLCTDNAAMIAWVGIEKYQISTPENDLSFEPRAKWPL